jgi:hypothetical protein
MFVFRARPKHDESYLGFLIRLAEINSYDTAYWILKAAHLPPETFQGYCSFPSNPEVGFLPLARLTGLNVKEITSLLYRRNDSHGVNAFGHRVSRYVLTHHRCKVCPACLRQSNYRRKQWDFAVVTSCPIHRSMLMDECHACCKPITWGARAGVSLCPCGADWREGRMSPLPDAEVLVSRLVYRHFGLLPSDRTDSKSNPLYSFPLASVLEALFLIASQQEGQNDISGKYILAEKKSRRIHEKLLRAYMILNRFPRQCPNY